MQADQGQPGADFESAADEIAARLQEGKRSATEALHDARDEITRKATDYAAEAKGALLHRAESAQRDIGSNLTAFGGALRAASEHLANSQQTTASKFVLDAAGGLESLSNSLKNKSFEDVLGDLRSIGRGNAAALVAASVLGGLALGRFLKSSSPATPQQDRDNWSMADAEGSRDWQTQTVSDAAPFDTAASDGWPDLNGESAR